MNSSLYYDGSCPVCAKEIGFIERWKNASLDLIEIHSMGFADQNFLKSKSELLTILHYKTKQGQWLLGLDATVAAWGHTPFGFLFKPLRWPIIKPVADKLYNSWAQKRACRLGYAD